MIKLLNKIIVVDDKERDLINLALKFSEINLSYRLIHYDLSYDANPIKGVRLAFFDINLTDTAISLTECSYDYKDNNSVSSVFNYLANAISQIISKENGPFILIFWSENTILINSFKEYVKERGSNLPKPLYIDCIDKTLSPEEIKDKINEILNLDVINLLFDFEYKCEVASSKTINEFLSYIPYQNNDWGANIHSDAENDLINCLNAISIASHGKNAEKNKDLAIAEGLNPILSHHLYKLSKKGVWTGYLDGSKSNIDDNLKAKLNSFLHIDVDEGSMKDEKRRGVVIHYPKILSGEKGCPYVSNKDIYKECEEKSIHMLSRFFPFKHGKSLFENRIFWKFISESIPIVIEISAACDYSQNKDRNMKYIGGILTPYFPVNELKSFINYKCIPSSIFYRELPMIMHNNKKYLLWIDLNRIYSTLDVEKKGDILFCFKNEIVSLIGNRYANHISRIGITSFF